MNGFAASLAPASVYYPVFALLLAIWLLVSRLLRVWARRSRWDGAVIAVERGTLTLLFLALLVLATTQIVLRNFFHSGLVWIDPLARHLVLWLGFVGAVVATGQLRHVHMDIIGRSLPERPRVRLQRGILIIAAVVCAVLSRAAWLFLIDEAAFSSNRLLGLESWKITSIIFAGFVIMAARFAARALYPTAALLVLERKAMGGDDEPRGENGAESPAAHGAARPGDVGEDAR